ncbi:glycoside hydrolase family 27 protein [Sphingomonas sp. IC081]|uniref:glycoside hydrolase family 27 protein n=1 Tax=Sphingomonas sp. IC081 TaxID=304378 RepID=UPI00115B6480|nr:glycoside hydrolase family 27 protein [Sphingomonas sp. IC081]QDK31928.1 alpha-galactosidase [Sphingomonas sp. IC081]
MELSRRSALIAAAAAPLAGMAARAVAAEASGALPTAPGAALAPRPPMGWNSWNSFAGTITEAQALETAAIMRDRLLPFGYDVFTVDIQWYEPEARSYTYNAHPVPALDANGRLIPAPNRFPSSKGGKGFAPLAAKVHAMGMKFGIHVMRGIARLAVEQNLPILGTPYRARDIADTNSICPWNPDMYGVDMSKPGAQAYYDSLFRLYASWGVDFVKMDDMSRPYDAHAPEIEAAASAIARCGRPIVLSLSPGETPVPRGADVRKHAQMWRISDDFWDEWPQLLAQFTRLENWSPFAGPGSWPDADMLPLGRIALGDRASRFTPDEQQTLMSLWSIARSPLIMGGDLRGIDDATLALLTNREVLAVNQHSTANRPHFLADNTRVWSARAEGSEDRYLALFNTGEAPLEVAVPLRELGLSRATVRDLWQGADLGVSEGRVRVNLRPHASALYRLKAG